MYHYLGPQPRRRARQSGPRCPRPARRRFSLRIYTQPLDSNTAASTSRPPPPSSAMMRRRLSSPSLRHATETTDLWTPPNLSKPPMASTVLIAEGNAIWRIDIQKRTLEHFWPSFRSSCARMVWRSMELPISRTTGARSSNFSRRLRSGTPGSATNLRKPKSV